MRPGFALAQSQRITVRLFGSRPVPFERLLYDALSQPRLPHGTGPVESPQGKHTGLFQIRTRPVSMNRAGAERCGFQSQRERHIGRFLQHELELFDGDTVSGHCAGFQRRTRAPKETGGFGGKWVAPAESGDV